MSRDDPRAELAGVVHALRRKLERDAWGGHAELLVMGAKNARRMEAAGGGTAKAPPDPAPGAPLVPSVPADDPPASRGASLRAAAPRAVRSVAAPAPAGDDAPLHPRHPDARRRIAAAAAPELARIAAEVAACQACELWRTRTRAVPGVGSALSGVVFVGEAPGADEDRKGEPFVGRGGQLLDRIIKAMDDAKLIPDVPLNRDTVFIGNVLHCRPPDNRVPLPFEIQSSSPFLRRQLEVLEPRIICCLGKTSGEHMLGIKSALASMRGKTYRLGGAKVIVTYHPAAVLRNPELKRPVWEDMQFLAREYLKD